MTLEATEFDPMAVDLSTLTLEQLEVASADAIRLGEEALKGALLVFIRWGEILLEVQRRVGHGHFREWLRAHEINDAHSNKAMRFAFYKNNIPKDALVPFRGVDGRLREPTTNSVWRLYIRGLPPISPYGRPTYSVTHINEARRLQATGLTGKDIAEMLGVSETTVGCWLDPKLAAEREARRTRKRHETVAARKALKEKSEREERDRLAKTTGGELAEAYSLIRRALTALDRAGQVDAMRLAHRCEDEIVKALREARTES